MPKAKRIIWIILMIIPSMVITLHKTWHKLVFSRNGIGFGIRTLASSGKDTILYTSSKRYLERQTCPVKFGVDTPETSRFARFAGRVARCNID